MPTEVWLSEPITSPYARWRATPLGMVTERLEMDQVLGLVGPLENERVLDIGTGDGTYALEAASRGADVTGIDADPLMIHAAEARAASRRISVKLVNGQVEALPFEDATFDLVLAVTVLCFVEETTTAFREMTRVLRPGGRLVVGELGRYSTWAALRRVRGWFGSRVWRAAHFWSRAELRRQMTGAGLCVVATRGAIHYPPIAWAARMFESIDPWLSSVRAPGAAFLVVSADKPTVREDRNGGWG